MGLITRIRKFNRKSRQMRILILGLDGSGKSSLVARWLKEDLSQVAPTFGFQIRSHNHAGITLHFWDIGGQKSIRPFWRTYYEDTDGIIFVVDASLPHRLADSLAELPDLLDNGRLTNASILILANKQDCESALGVAEVREALQLDQLMKCTPSSTWNIMGCSAVTGDNVDESLNWLVNNIANRLYQIQDPSISDPEILLNRTMV